jgi:hypothetical protein
LNQLGRVEILVSLCETLFCVKAILIPPAARGVS